MDTKTTVIPLNGKNYPTWKVQCRMALIKDGLWGIVKGTEEAPGGGNAEARRKYEARRDRALALVVLAVEPSLLYLLGDPEDQSWKSNSRGRHGQINYSCEENSSP